MGRGRKGPAEQSFKKPKVHNKNGKWTGMGSGTKEKEAPVVLSEGLLQEMQRIGAQNLMRILLPRQLEDPEGGEASHIASTT